RSRRPRRAAQDRQRTSHARQHPQLHPRQPGLPLMFDDETDSLPSSLPPARPVLTWPGGKRRMLKYILPLIPDHLRYVEPFGGGLAVFLGKPPSHVEVINDIQSELVSFYRCVRYHLDALMD